MHIFVKMMLHWWNTSIELFMANRYHLNLIYIYIYIHIYIKTSCQPLQIYLYMCVFYYVYVSKRFHQHVLIYNIERNNNFTLFRNKNYITIIEHMIISIHLLTKTCLCIIERAG